MTDPSATKRRLILGGFVGAVLLGFLVICLAGSGTIPPEPALGIVGLVSSGVILSTGAWRWSRRAR